MSSIRFLFWKFSALLAFVVIAGCQPVLKSTSSIQTSGYGCHSNTGAYQLPKRLVKVSIIEEAKASQGASPKKEYYIQLDTEDELVAEKETVYCLDFLFSPFVESQIGISRNKELLLQEIGSVESDKSKQITKSLIRAAGNLVAANRAQQRIAELENAGPGGRSATVINGDGQPVKASFHFDPFDKREAKLVNMALKRFGYCLHLDDRRDSRVPPWAPQVCHRSSTRRSGNSLTDKAYAMELAAAKKVMHKGVLYRPEISHRMKIYRKLDPDDNLEAWHLAGSVYLNMPNRAPIFALSVNRALFVDSKTTVEFENGLMKNVALDKKSELNAIVDIPLYAINVVLDIPAATLRIFNNEADNRRKLMAVNVQMINLLKQQGDQILLDEAIEQGLVSIPQAIIPASPVVGINRTEEIQKAQLKNSCLEDEAFKNDAENLALCKEILQLEATQGQ